jgi:hypothetical protein
MSRRRFLGATCGAGAGTFLGLLDPRILYGQTEPDAKAKHVILLWMGGGMSHLDTFDPKPGTAQGGPFGAIETAAESIRISEHLPLLAKQFNDISLIRSLTSKEGSHERASYLMHTGYAPLGSFQHSSIGSVLSYMAERDNPDLPAYVSVSGQNWPAGHIGPAFAPFHVATPTDATRNIDAHRSIDAKGLNGRLDLLIDLDKSFAGRHRGDETIAAYAEHYRAALRMMRSRGAAAFDLTGESAELRQRYGMGPFGQGCLLARRLVQAGVRFVEVALDGWDTHQENFDRVRLLSTNLDTGFSALLADLRAKDLLDTTLIVLASEFGRTPTINGTEGRDHWPRVWTVGLAGGGVKGGKVIGESTAGGEEVADSPTSVGQLHATICHAMGLSHRQRNTGPDGRPIRVVNDRKAEPIRSLFA